MMDKKIAEPSRKLPYHRPVLQVFGPLAAITATMSSAGSIMDGGPNNKKS
jgi:hypothetical protein